MTASERREKRPPWENAPEGALVRVVVLDHFSFEDSVDPKEELERPILLEYIGFLNTSDERYLVLTYGRTLQGGRKRRSEGIALVKTAIVDFEVLRPPGKRKKREVSG